MSTPDPNNLIQEKLVTKGENENPEYHRLLEAYTKDPLYDLALRQEEKEKNLKKTEELPV